MGRIGCKSAEVLITNWLFSTVQLTCNERSERTQQISRRPSRHPVTEDIIRWSIDQNYLHKSSAESQKTQWVFVEQRSGWWHAAGVRSLGRSVAAAVRRHWDARTHGPDNHAWNFTSQQPSRPMTTAASNTTEQSRLHHAHPCPHQHQQTPLNRNTTYPIAFWYHYLSSWLKSTMNGMLDTPPMSRD